MPYQKTKEGRLVNEITLGDGYPLSNDKQPLKVGGEASIINVSSPTPDGSVDGEVEIKGNFKAKDTQVEGNFSATSIESQPQFKFHSRNNVSARLDIEASANQNAALRLRNNQGYFELKRQFSTTSLQFTDGTNTPLTLDGNTATFTGDVTVDTDTLHVDSSNNRVGIGTTSPDDALDIGISGSDARMFLVEMQVVVEVVYYTKIQVAQQDMPYILKMMIKLYCQTEHLMEQFKYEQIQVQQVQVANKL